MKTEGDYLYGWTTKWSHTENLTKMVNPRDIAGNAEEEDKEDPPSLSPPLSLFLANLMNEYMKVKENNSKKRMCYL